MIETKQFFEEPELDVIQFNDTDVIATSGLLDRLLNEFGFEDDADTGAEDGGPGRNDTPYEDLL